MRMFFGCLLMLILLPRYVAAQYDFVHDLIYSGDGTMIAVTRYALIEVLEVRGTEIGEPFFQISAAEGETLSADWHPDYDTLLVVTSDTGKRQFWGLADPNGPERVFLEPSPETHGSEDTEDYSSQVVASRDEVTARGDIWGGIYIREIDSCPELWYEDVGDEPTWIKDMAFRPHHTQLAVGIQAPHMIHVIDWVAQTTVDILIDDSNLIGSMVIAWSPDGRYVAYGEYEIEIFDLNAYETSFAAPPPIHCDFSPMSGYDLSEAIRVARDAGSTITICLAKGVVYDPYLSNVYSNDWDTTWLNPFNGSIRLEGNGAILDLKLHGIVEVTEAIEVDTEGMDGWNIVSSGSLYIHNLTIRSGMSDGPGIVNSGDLYLDHVIFENYGAYAPYSDQILLWNNGRYEENPATVCANEVLFRNTDSSSGTVILNDGGEVTVINSVFERNSPTFGRYVIEQGGEAVTDVRGSWWGTADGPLDQIEPGVLFEPFALEPFAWFTDVAPGPHP